MSVTLWLRLLCLPAALYLSGCGGAATTAGAEPPYEPGGANPPACENASQGINTVALLTAPPCLRLSDYGLFRNPQDPRQNPEPPGLAYGLNSALFTDHARKYRFLFLPTADGTLQPAQYREEGVLEFPPGTVLVKVFTLPADTALPGNEQLVEVRLLIHRENGWLGLPYRWNAALGDGYFSGLGSTIAHSLIHNGEPQTLNYSIPPYASCRTCHGLESMQPIGLKAWHLHHPDVSRSTVQRWAEDGLLQGLPDDSGQIPYAPDWQDDTAPLQDRAKAYLDINCAHCHRDDGSAALSGLRLEYLRRTIDYRHGVCNSAHGWRGGGFDIWPGRGDESSLPLRMELNGAADRMPPLGRSIADTDAVTLIRSWIDSLPYQNCGQ